jgi:hydrogenase nickel incorporation protein HypA/HybF
MHELSLMQGILDSIEPVAQENGASRVTEIALTIGEMTEVVEEAMQFAFEALTQDEDLYEGAQLTMNFVAPKSKCLDCGTEFEHDRYHLRCPECNSGATMILEGKELHIASIEVDIP